MSLCLVNEKLSDRLWETMFNNSSVGPLADYLDEIAAFESDCCEFLEKKQIVATYIHTADRFVDSMISNDMDTPELSEDEREIRRAQWNSMRVIATRVRELKKMFGDF